MLWPWSISRHYSFIRCLQFWKIESRYILTRWSKIIWIVVTNNDFKKIMLVSLKIVCNSLKKEVKSKPKHPGCKNKSGLGEKDVRSNGQPRPLLLIGTKVLVMMMLLQNNVILGVQGLLMWRGSKFVIKMTRLQRIVLSILMFCSLIIFIKTFDPINIRRPWALEITMFCSDVITKTFVPIKSRGLGCSFEFK